MKEIYPTLLKIVASQIDFDPTNLQSVSPGDAVELLVPQSGANKKVSLGGIKSWLFDPNNLPSTSPSDTTPILVPSTTTPQRLTLGDIKNWINAQGLTDKGGLNFNGDWNTYTTPGVYTIYDIPGTPTNAPPATYKWGQLIVFQSTYSGNIRITQIYITDRLTTDPFTQYNFWVRQNWGVNGSGTWTPWVNLNPPPNLIVNGLAWASVSLGFRTRQYLNAHLFTAPYNLVAKLSEVGVRTTNELTGQVTIAVNNISVLSYVTPNATGTRITNPGNTTGTITAGSMVEISVAIYNNTALSVNLMPADYISARVEIAKV